MELPKNIEQKILEYLHLEYGEDSESDTSLKLSDIEFVGEFNVNGTEIFYWSYPIDNEVRWATVEPYENSYLIGMVTELPKN
jgi:hypothetical protein